jgi:signal peptidase I
VVFRYPGNPKLSFVKRVIGIGGDRVRVEDGRVFVNDYPAQLKKIRDWDESEPGEDLSGETDASDQSQSWDFFEFDEIFPQELNPAASSWRVRQYSPWDMNEVVVPEGTLFVMGDNRQASSDSREWGFVEEGAVLGRVRWIWLSCERRALSTGFCDLKSLRSERFFRRVR